MVCTCVTVPIVAGKVVVTVLFWVWISVVVWVSIIVLVIVVLEQAVGTAMVRIINIAVNKKRLLIAFTPNVYWQYSTNKFGMQDICSIFCYRTGVLMMVCSRAGPTQTMLAGQPMSSSSLVTNFIAISGSSSNSLTPVVSDSQPSSSS